MHRLVIYSQPLSSPYQCRYGKLVGGNTILQITKTAGEEYFHLILQDLWWDEIGDEWRDAEGWREECYDDELVPGWVFDINKYTFENKIYPEEFVSYVLENIEIEQEISVVSSWIPIRFSDFDQCDFIINPSLYESIMKKEVPQWQKVLLVKDLLGEPDLPS